MISLLTKIDEDKILSKVSIVLFRVIRRVYRLYTKKNTTEVSLSLVCKWGTDWGGALVRPCKILYSLHVFLIILFAFIDRYCRKTCDNQFYSFSETIKHNNVFKISIYQLSIDTPRRKLISFYLRNLLEATQDSSSWHFMPSYRLTMMRMDDEFTINKMPQNKCSILAIIFM